MRKILILGLLVAISAWSQPASSQTVFSIDSEIEELLGLRVDARGLTFQVHSSGCTKKADFEVHIFEATPMRLVLVRIRADFCDALVPYGKRIRFSFPELGLSQGQRQLIAIARAANCIPIVVFCPAAQCRLLIKIRFKYNMMIDSPTK